MPVVFSVRPTVVFLETFSILVAPLLARGQEVVVPTTATRAPAATAVSTAGIPRSSLPINNLILSAIQSMPQAGGYAANGPAIVRLAAAVRVEGRSSPDPRFEISPGRTAPTFCSAATYLVFLKAVETLRERREVSLSEAQLDALRIAGQRDGTGVWGRWNANGPGTARLFHELQLGRNFTDFAQAQPGDFMKIFWTNEIGRREKGHSVVFLGTERGPGGVEQVKFWSANIPTGYGEKIVPRTKIARAIFSRFENPRAVAAAANRLAETDVYLARMVTSDSNPEEVRRLCGM